MSDSSGLKYNFSQHLFLPVWMHFHGHMVVDDCAGNEEKLWRKCGVQLARLALACKCATVTFLTL